MLIPPILDNKHTLMPSVFVPTALLREARRQKKLKTMEVPPVCILDPDGDVVRHLRQNGSAKPLSGWPCYHTELDTFDLGGRQVGIVGRVVGASFAVLVAEELFPMARHHNIPSSDYLCGATIKMGVPIQIDALQSLPHKLDQEDVDRES